MLKHYFKISLRLLLRNKGYTITNILGLSISMAAVILTASFVFYEVGFEKSNPKANQIHRVVFKGEDGPGFHMVPEVIGEAMIEKYPEIESFLRLEPMGSDTEHTLISSEEASFYEEGVLYADPSLMDFFDLDVVSGDSANALVNPNTAVVTASFAKKMFGSLDAIGKIIQVDKKESFEIKAVVEDQITQSHFQGDIFLSYSTLDEDINRVGWRITYSYVMLSKEADVEFLRAKMGEDSEEMLSPTKSFGGEKMDLFPLKKVHLYGDFGRDLSQAGDINTVLIFASISLLILVVGCINYANLFTAKSLQRVKEIGVRKVVGAARRQLMVQFITESFILGALSVSLGFAIAERLVTFFGNLVSRNLNIEFSQPWVYLLVIGMLGVVALLGVTHLIVVVLRIPSVIMLKGSLTNGKRGSLRKILLGIQFVITLGLIMTTSIIQGQFHLFDSKDVGFNQSNLLAISTRGELAESYESFRNELMTISGIEKVGLSSVKPTQARFAVLRGSDIESLGKDSKERFFIGLYDADEVFTELLNLKLALGDLLPKDNQDRTPMPVLVNEQAVKKFGWSREILGQKLKVQRKDAVVVGLVKDFHFRPLNLRTIEPLIITPLTNAPKYIVLKVSADRQAEVLEASQRLWKNMVKDRPFQYSFVEDDLGDAYEPQKNLANLFSLFSTIAIVISLMGLIALVNHTAQKRKKEIGIRKVLGARVKQIVAMLSYQFLTTIIVAFVLISPFVWYFMNQWLNDFPYQISINAGYFLLPLIGVVIVSFTSVALQSYRAATTNPVLSLRDE